VHVSREGITFVVDEAVQEARFARGSITNDDEFEEIIVSLGHLASLLFFFFFLDLFSVVFSLSLSPLGSYQFLLYLSLDCTTSDFGLRNVAGRVRGWRWCDLFSLRLRAPQFETQKKTLGCAGSRLRPTSLGAKESVP
jgi:hypothetical protein